MRRRYGSILTGCILLSGLQGFAAVPTVQQLVSQFAPISYSNILSHALYTRVGMNRAAGTGAHHDLCRDSIYTQFVNAGVSPYLDYFQYQDSNNVTRAACNIVAVKHGVQNPLGEIYIAGAHYDSKSNPGADDNGTGVAAIIEMARIFSQYTFAKTIVFVALDCEEIWDYNNMRRRLGGVHFAGQLMTSNVASMISVDMIGHEANSTPNTAWLYGWGASYPVTNTFASALITYGGLQVRCTTSNPNISDHLAFHNIGIPACLLIESSWSSDNPFYHTSGDSLDQSGNISWNYAFRMTKGVIGYYAERLQPVDIEPRAIALQPIAGGTSMDLTFSGLAGCRYAVETTTNLISGQWGAVATNSAGSNGLFNYTDTQAATKARAFFRARFVSGAPLTATNRQHVIDNPKATAVGLWTNANSTIVDRYHYDYMFASVKGTGATYVEFRPTIPAAGNYEVYEWHSVGSNRTTDAPHEIKHASGQQVVRVNQQVSGGRWNLLGTYAFSAGTNNYVRIRDDFTTGTVVMADAIRFVEVP